MSKNRDLSRIRQGIIWNLLLKQKEKKITAAQTKTHLLDLGIKDAPVNDDFDAMVRRFGFLGLEKDRHSLYINQILLKFQATPFWRRLAQNNQEKKAIGHYIVKNLINDDDRLLLAAGTTMAAVTEEIILQEKKVDTIITNSIFSYFLLGLLPGLILQPTSGNYDVGSFEHRGEESVKSFRNLADAKAIFSVAAISKKGNFFVWDKDQEPVLIELLSPENKKERIIALDNSKLGVEKNFLISGIDLWKIKANENCVLVVDEKISPQQDSLLKSFQDKSGIKIKRTPI